MPKIKVIYRFLKSAMGKLSCADFCCMLAAQELIECRLVICLPSSDLCRLFSVIFLQPHAMLYALCPLRYAL